jgi:aspartyl-tRNA(Asn)/glutamyl-tRNA(Gln) amidotransferase subunit C
VISLVSREEIEHVAKLMKIELDDHQVHIDRVEKMISYFDILDSAGTESEELVSHEQPLDAFREDKYLRYDENLIKKLKNYKGKYVRAPKMV